MRTHARFFLVDQLLVPVVFNFVLNGWLASQLFAHLPSVPLWGLESIGLDTLATSFLLPFLTFVITARLLGVDRRTIQRRATAPTTITATTRGVSGQDQVSSRFTPPLS